MTKKVKGLASKMIKAPVIQNGADQGARLPEEVKREGRNLISNGLGEAILGFNPGSIGTQLNQVDTLFKNQRWYLISNMRQVLSEAYVEHGIIQTLIDVPVNDGMRGGVTFKSKQLSPEQLEALHADFNREQICSAVIGQAMKWNRLFGGAGILILTDEDPATPFNPKNIQQGDQIDFRAVDMWELFYDKQNTEGFNPMVQEHESDHFNYYGVKLHRSRVMKLKGLTAPSFIRPRLRGWGFSVVESLLNSFNQYLKSNNLVFEVLDEFKIDVFGIEGLSETLASGDGQNKVRQRVQLANSEKNFNHAITMDSKDRYEQKQLTFSGLAEVYREIRMQIAADLRMPITKLFGVSSAGFSSGEDDIENYNAMVESEIRAKSHRELVRIAEIKAKQLWGILPTDLEVEFRPLRVLSAEQEENVKEKKFNRLLQAQQQGLLSVKEFKDAVNKDNLLPIQLDTTDDFLDTNDTNSEDDNANKEDSQQSKSDEETES